MAGQAQGQASSPGCGPEPTLLKVTSVAFLWDHLSCFEHHMFFLFSSLGPRWEFLRAALPVKLFSGPLRGGGDGERAVFLTNLVKLWAQPGLLGDVGDQTQEGGGGSFSATVLQVASVPGMHGVRRPQWALLCLHEACITAWCTKAVLVPGLPESCWAADLSQSWHMAGRTWPSTLLIAH